MQALGWKLREFLREFVGGFNEGSGYVGIDGHVCSVLQELSGCNNDGMVSPPGPNVPSGCTT